MARRRKRLMQVVVAVACLTGAPLWACPAYADLVAGPMLPLALTDADTALLASNPDLAALAAAAPWLVRQALDLIASSGARDLPRDGLGQTTIDPVRVPDPIDRRMLETNPNLRELWRLSPDPALALLHLIRAAGSAPKLN